MDKGFMDVVMNPVRLRIVQYLMIHETGTTGEIRQDIADVPAASLYRHMKILLEANCIAVTEEKQVRGTMEKRYQLVQNPLGEPTEGDIAGMFQAGLFALMTDFQKYFSKEEADPQKDLLGFSTSVLMLSDEEYMEMMQKIGAIYNEVIGNKAGEGRRPRRITIVSSPSEN